MSSSSDRNMRRKRPFSQAMSNSPNIAARARSWTRRARTSLHLYSDDNDDWISFSTKLHTDKQTHIHTDVTNQISIYTLKWKSLWMWNQKWGHFSTIHSVKQLATVVAQLLWKWQCSLLYHTIHLGICSVVRIFNINGLNNNYSIMQR